MLSTTLFISGSEIFIILIVVLLLFGANKLPEIARGLGKGMNEFKRATRDIRSEFDEQTRDIQNEVKDIKKDIEDQTRFNLDQNFLEDNDASENTTPNKNQDSESGKKEDDSSTTDDNKPSG